MSISEIDLRVLESLVSGYLAREGTKDRFRSLNEYEIARRCGITSYSYVEYETSQERPDIQTALITLQQLGLVSFARSSGRYDAYVPTERGTETVTSPTHGVGSEAPAVKSPQVEVLPWASRNQPTANQSFERKLDEIIELLRSIDRRLDRERA